MSKEFQAAPRRAGFIYPVLSEKDEFVPKTHIGMYTIFRNPNNKNVYMSEQACQKIRRKTFDGLLEIFKKYGSPNIADLFNYNIQVITDIGLNHFARQPKIAPLANVIECFTTKETGSRVIQVSFGLSREVLAYYFKTRCVPIMRRNKAKSRDLILFGAEQIDIGNDDTITVDRSALYRKFVDWCELQGVDQQEGILMALELLFENYPLPALLPTSEYDFLTEFDRPLFAKRRDRLQGKTVHSVELSNVVAGLAEDIIARYNRDPDNATKKIDFNSYVNNALHLLNSSMDLKYQNPELYQEQLETQRFVEYNKNQLKERSKQ